MEGTIGYILAFAGGALVGGFAAYKIAEDKAEERAEMEIEEMRKYFLEKATKRQKKQKESTPIEKSKRSQNKPAIADLAQKTSDTQAVNYTMYSESVPEEVVVTSEPVILRRDADFGAEEGYSTVYLVYYDDDILADDDTKQVLSKNDMERAIGRKAIDMFKKVDKNGDPIDVVHVRNDRTKTYYEIVRDSREYYEAVGWRADDEDDY